MQISKYLDYIKSGKPINFDIFCKHLHKQGYDSKAIFKIFSTQKIAKLSYQVSIIDEERFVRLQADFPEYTITNRVSAALAGDSHKYPVSQAMIILWPNQHSHPVVVLNDTSGIITPVTLGQRLLIIENQENFVQKNKSLAFLKFQFPDFNDEGLDIAWGSGNAISNRLNKAFFDHYQHIACLLDLDIGGLTTFANICELTAHPRISFLLPPCTDEQLKKSKLDLQNEHLPTLRKFRENYPPLRAAIELMTHRLKMLEQEIYLQK